MLGPNIETEGSRSRPWAIRGSVARLIVALLFVAILTSIVIATIGGLAHGSSGRTCTHRPLAAASRGAPDRCR